MFVSAGVHHRCDTFIPGNLQRDKSSFMVVKVDPDLIKKSDFDRDLTRQIHNQFKTENHDLSKGTFVRGKKRPETVPSKTDAWLTFGGAQRETSSTGIIDAFACKLLNGHQ